MSFDRERYDDLKRLGVCVVCKGEPEPGKVRCRVDLDQVLLAPSSMPTAKRNAQKMESARKAVERGVCKACRVNRVAFKGMKHDSWRCDPCGEKHRQAERERYARRHL